MRIQLLSDLHFEFQRDNGRTLAQACHARDVDVLVLAGDIAVADGIAHALELFSELYPHVVYVHGNHEFYGSTRDEVARITREACARLGNVHWLDCNVVEIAGQRFVGTPLWFPASEAATRYQAHLSDFALIRDYGRWVYAEHQRARHFLGTELRPGDVTVTHHLPSQASVLDEYRDSPLNCYFVADMEDLIRERKPALWMHGHTHGSVDVMVGETRVLCNPFGYARRGENAGFQEKLMIELSDNHEQQTSTTAGVRRKLGTLRGELRIADDFDGPLRPDTQAGFDGEPSDE